MNARSQSVADRLAAEPKSGLGCANVVAEEVIERHDLLPELIRAVADPRPCVRVRASNALKKVQQADPALCQPFAKKLLRVALQTLELQARWNLIIVVGGLHLRGREKALAIDLMFEAMASNSRLLRTFAMQSLVNYTLEDAALRPRVKRIVEDAADNGTAAIRARARKLLPQLS